MEKVTFIKQVKGLNTYTSVIDTRFTELVQPTAQTEEEEITVAKFFEYYDRLFYDIPAEGDINSHKYIVERSSEYLGGSGVDSEKAALIEEINSLRQQLLDIGDAYTTINKTTF